MATVIDSLVVSVGLDPTNFVKGSKGVQDAFAKTKTQAVSDSKKIEESTKNVEVAIGKVTGVVLGLFAVMLGGRGFKEFIADTNAANAALGRFSANLGQAPQDVGELSSLVERLGGTSQDTASALEGANKVIQDFLVNGKGIPEVISRMTAQVGGSVDFEHGVLAYVESLAPILQRMNTLDPAKAHAFAQALGLPDSVANTMIKYGAGLKQAMEGTSNLQATKDQIAAAQELGSKWAEVQQHVAALGNVISEHVDHPIVVALDHLQHFIDLLTFASKGGTSGVVSGQVHGWGELIGDYLKFQHWVDGWLPGGSSSNPAPKLGPGGKVPFNPGHTPKTPNDADLPAEGATPQSLSLSPSDFAAATGVAQPISIDGSEVSKSNPLPVSIVQQGASGGLWDWLTGGAGGGSGGGSGPVGALLGAVGGFMGGGKGGATDGYGSSPHVTSAEGVRRAQSVVAMLKSEYGLTDTQAIGAAGVMGYESGDFRTMQEKGQPAGRGGWGYAQWTGPRRHAFMAWAAANKLDPSSPEANEGFLKYEIAHNPSYQAAIAKLKQTKTVGQAAYAWERYYEGMTEGGSGIPAFGAHIARAESYAKIPNIASGASGAAALSNIGSQYSATNDNSSNSMHIGSISVNAPNATDANGIAAGIQPALAKYGFAQFANSGPM